MDDLRKNKPTTSTTLLAEFKIQTFYSLYSTAHPLPQPPPHLPFTDQTKLPPSFLRARQPAPLPSIRLPFPRSLDGRGGGDRVVHLALAVVVVNQGDRCDREKLHQLLPRSQVGVCGQVVTSVKGGGVMIKVRGRARISTWAGQTH